jgi:hypothetical protein
MQEYTSMKYKAIDDINATIHTLHRGRETTLDNNTLTQAKTTSCPRTTIRWAASNPIPELHPVINIRFLIVSS